MLLIVRARAWQGHPLLNPLDVWVWEVMAEHDMLGAALAVETPIVSSNDTPGGAGSLREAQGRLV